MVRITKRGLTGELDKKILDNFLKEIKNLKNPEELNDFLTKFLTADEQIMIKKRLAIPLLLKEGKRKKHISEILDVSRSTINFIQRGLTKSSKPKIENLQNKRKKYWSPIYRVKGNF
jgi:uncharacterized protein YerC